MTSTSMWYSRRCKISIHIPRVGDDPGKFDLYDDNGEISIHIPRVGDDKPAGGCGDGSEEFQSTSPVWGMTQLAKPSSDCSQISIHIPRVGDDKSLT